jgi:hypothetical protein
MIYVIHVFHKELKDSPYAPRAPTAKDKLKAARDQKPELIQLMSVDHVYNMN